MTMAELEAGADERAMVIVFLLVTGCWGRVSAHVKTSRVLSDMNEDAKMMMWWLWWWVMLVGKR